MTVVDTHSHLFPADWAGAGRMPADMFDVEGYLAEREQAGVAVSLVSDPHIWYGDLDLGSIERTREYNDFAAELQRAHPGRVAGLATVSPWRGDDHLDEARRAIQDLGLRGLALATSDEGRYLDAVPDDFWTLAEELDAPVFLHPGGTVVGQEHMGEYRLGEVCGRPLDMTLALSRFILMGYLERFRSLRLLCAHAGGGICAIADRLDFGHELRAYRPLGPWGDVELSEPPSAFVSRLYLDTVTYGPGLLRLALERVGVERVVYGSDHPPVPFPLERTLGIVRALGLPAEQEGRILGGNAVELFALGAAAG